MMSFLKDMDALKARFASAPEGLDVVNIGSGPSYYDFDWSVIPGVKGYNFAIAPEDFRYDKRIIMHYGSHVRPGGVVVVVVCPLSFGRNDYLYKHSFSEKYTFILPEKLVDIPEWIYKIYRRVPAVLGAKKMAERIYAAVLYRLRQAAGKPQPTDPVTSMVQGWINDNRLLRDLKDERQADSYLDTFQEKIDDLRGVIDSCRAQRLRPVLLLPPLSAELRSYMSDAFIKRFVYDNLEQVRDDDVPLLDYLDDTRFQGASNYTNGLFLTERMRRDFTEIVWSDIQKRFAK